MKLKPKGRKIYREKSRFERLRTFWSNTGAVVGTVLLIAVLGFVGYSAGGPVLRFLQDKEIIAKPDASSEAAESSAAEQTELQESGAETATDESAAETEPVQTEPMAVEPPAQITMRGYQLPTSALATKDALEAALTEVPEDATHILVPLKGKGGGLYYATKLEDGIKAVQSAMPLESVCETIKVRSAEPVAVINTLEDQIYPMNFQDASYRMAGSGARWLDPSGMVWMAPFSGLTVDYLSNIAKEANDAGFRAIVCEGLVFPEFPEADVNNLDSRCTAPDRYTSLVKLVESMQQAAPEAEFYIRIDGLDVLTNRKDAVTAADQLDIGALLVGVNAATKDNTEILRGISSVHPCVLSWEADDLPSGEESFTVTLKTETKKDASRNPRVTLSFQIKKIKRGWRLL